MKIGGDRLSLMREFATILRCTATERRANITPKLRDYLKLQVGETVLVRLWRHDAQTMGFEAKISKDWRITGPHIVAGKLLPGYEGLFTITKVG